MKILLLALLVSITLSGGVLLTAQGVVHHSGWFLAFGLSCLFAIPPWTCALAMEFLRRNPDLAAPREEAGV